MLSLRSSKTIVVGSTLLFVTACTVSYRTCMDAGSSDTATSFRSTIEPQKAPLNKQAVKFVSDYIEKNNESLSRIRQNSSSPFRTIDQIFRKYGLPVELKYLAVVESELKPTAISRVGALGPWQLMPETAKVLGLKITPVYDERTQYNKSTKAAALYLRDLHAEFDDWLLVLAAYNSGPAPVYRAIRKSGSRNFWRLQYYLPAETRDHVKKFIATQYYFEGQGSETTLTRAENLDYIKSQVMAVSNVARNTKQEMPVAMADLSHSTRKITRL